MESARKSSSDQSSSRQSYNTVYVKDPLKVQRELIEAIDPELLPKLQAIFYTKEWEQQSNPVPRYMIKPLCSRESQTKQIMCVFCPDSTFVNTDRAIEHIQKDHLGLRPFCCKERNWWVVHLSLQELERFKFSQWKDVLAQQRTHKPYSNASSPHAFAVSE